MAMNSTVPWELSDKSRLLITAHVRLQMLIDGGFKFEACAVQGTVIEALLFFSIISAAAAKTAPENKSISDNLSSLTLGGLIRRAREYSLLPSSILDLLDRYKEKRNVLVHHHLVELHDFHYEAALQEGEELIETMFKLVRQTVHSKMTAIGHRDADKFQD